MVLDYLIKKKKEGISLGKKKNQKTNAIRFLEQKKIAFEVAEYDWDEDHVSAKHTAVQLGLKEKTIFKTLVAVGNATGPIVAIVPADHELDLKKIAKVSGNKKVEMLPMRELEPLTGYVHGGCSPVGMKKKLPTYLAHEATELSEIHVSGGRRGIQLGIDPTDLIKVIGTVVADITT